MSDVKYFEYGEEAVAYLAAKDPALGRAIAEIGHIDRPVIPDLFAALVNSIVGQQISAKAAQTVWGRITERFSPLTAEVILSETAEALQACGISMRKATYIREISEEAAGGKLDLAALENMTDSEVRARLCALRGIGEWTAEMLMIFSMQRPDIISFGDLGIHRGLRMLYRHRKITPALFAKYRRRYAPYATVASLYLWAVSSGACGLTDPAVKKKVVKL